MKNFKIILRILIFIIIGILLYFIISPIFVPKTINSKLGFYRAIINGFYKEPKNSLDVLFIGDSSIYKGISPMEMWENLGFTSYDFASPTQKIWDSYYIIKEALEYQKPKVIVLNVDQLFSEKPMKDAYKRHLYDNIRLGKNKIEAILDPVQKNSKKRQFVYLFPFFRFHSRWSELTDDDFIYAYKDYTNPIKGYIQVNTARPYKKGNYMKRKNENDKIGPKAINYLEKIKKNCQESETELLLVEVPSPSTWNETKNKETEKWSKENEVDFLDMNLYLNEIGIDWEKDTEDGGIHLNTKGAQKVSDFIGKYLKQKYLLINHKEDLKYEQWNKDLIEYKNKCKNVKPE